MEIVLMNNYNFLNFPTDQNLQSSIHIAWDQFSFHFPVLRFCHHMLVQSFSEKASSKQLVNWTEIHLRSASFADSVRQWVCWNCKIKHLLKIFILLQLDRPPLPTAISGEFNFRRNARCIVPSDIPMRSATFLGDGESSSICKLKLNIFLTIQLSSNRSTMHCGKTIENFCHSTYQNS